MAGDPRTTIESHHCVIVGICYCPYRNCQIRVGLFIDRDSGSSSWPQICSVAQDDLEFLSFLPLPPQCWRLEARITMPVVCGAEIMGFVCAW